MDQKREALKLFIRAAADDLRDAEKLYDIARKMKALGDSSGARTFAARAKEHIAYVYEANRVFDACDFKDEQELKETRLAILEEDQADRIGWLETSLDSL